MHEKDCVRALGASTGNQAVQQVKAGLEAIYLSGWQVAADANLAGEMYPDQSLYPANSVRRSARGTSRFRREPGDTSPRDVDRFSPKPRGSEIRLATL